MNHMTLSRRNLLALLAKLDIVKAGGASACSLIKYQNAGDPGGQSMDSCLVKAMEDEDYYVTRAAGELHPDTVAKMGAV